MSNPAVLWSPPAGHTSRLGEFEQFVRQRGGPTFASYEELWGWSVTQLDAFWGAVWDFFQPPATGSSTPALAVAQMPGAKWFPKLRLNYAEAVLALPGRDEQDCVLISRSQSRAEQRWSATQLRDAVARARHGLVRAGVQPGDRVAAYAPNIPETLVLLLAAASLGAVFSSCAPEFGPQAVVDRLGQVEPTLLLCVDGYQYGAKAVDRRGEVEAIVAQLPSVRTVVWLPYLEPASSAPTVADQVTVVTWEQFVAEAAELEFTRLSFDAPLYVLFSSGTTGLPKAIVHGHGGILIEHLKALGLQHDLGPDDAFFWFSTTGWMMWNYLVSGLAVGATIVMYDGHPASPDLGMMWRMVEELEITFFGTSAPFLLQCRKESLVPHELADLSTLRGVGSTGAPLPAEGFEWVYEAVSSTAQLVSISGGTDICSAFVGGAPTVAVVAGQISCRCLGAAAAAYDADGNSVIGQLGELVIEQPMPSMPIGLWGDTDGQEYFEAYFADIPGVWRHGDWITISPQGTCVITGRSDATLNRGGVRLGTSDFYTVIEAMPSIADSLVVHLEDQVGGPGTLILFVQLRPGHTCGEQMVAAIRNELRQKLSPRHVPDVIHPVSVLPRTLSGKKIEVPVKRILQGTPVDQAVALGALAAPEGITEIEALRDQLARS